MALRNFEEELIAYWRRMGRAVRTQPRTGVWIKGHLEDLGEDYCYGAWKFHQLFIRQVLALGLKGLDESTYQEFALYWWLLKQERLIIPTRKEPGFGGVPRQYYTLNKKAPEYMWEINPREELHYTSKESRRVYRRKRRRLTTHP